MGSLCSKEKKVDAEKKFSVKESPGKSRAAANGPVAAKPAQQQAKEPPATVITPAATDPPENHEPEAKPTDEEGTVPEVPSPASDAEAAPAATAAEPEPVPEPEAAPAPPAPPAVVEQAPAAAAAPPEPAAPKPPAPTRVKPLEKIVKTEAPSPSVGRSASPPITPRYKTALPPGYVDWDRVVKEIQHDNYIAMRDSYKKNPSLFLTNNLLMSVQLFRNFDSDREKYQAIKLDTEAEICECLRDTRQRADILNVFSYQVLENVGFVSKQQDNILEQLLPVEYYISHDNIEVNRSEDYDRLVNGSMEYAALDQPYYRVCTEESGHNGYVKLRCVDSYDKLVTFDAYTPDGFALMANPEDGGGHSGVTALPTEPKVPANKDLLYDKFPEPVSVNEMSKLRINAIPSVVIDDNFTEEDTEDDEEYHESGADLLRTLEAKINLPPGTPAPGAQYSPRNEHGKMGGFSGRRGVRAIDNKSPLGPNKKSRGPDIPAPFGIGRPSSPRATGSKTQAPSFAFRKSSPPEGPEPPQPETPKEVIYNSEGEDSYGYSRNPKNLKDILSKNGFQGMSSSNSLPPRCFKQVEVVRETEYDDENPDPYPTDDIDMEQRVYISSRQFMTFFTYKFHELARRIHKAGLVGAARVLDPRIMTREERDFGSNSSHFAKESLLDFIPTIEVSFWPDEGIEWYLRKRTRIRDKRTKLIYQWPPKDLVSQARAQQTGFNLVPIGFHDHKESHKAKEGEEKDKAKKDSPEYSMEWQIHFTKAEASLQKTLNHPKLRFLLFVQLLFKTFLEESRALSDEHMRYKFYYMLEKMPVGWSDENLGAKLIEYIKEMLESLRKQKMPHYFLYKRNILSNLHSMKIRAAQERFHRMNENIVPHLLIALRWLEVSSSQPFYPKPNLQRLYNILTTQKRTDALIMMNPSLMGGQKMPKNMYMDEEENRRSSKESLRSNRSARSARIGHVDASQERMRRVQRKREQDKAKQKQLEDEQKDWSDSIDRNMKVEPFDEVRGRLVLEYFIEHFLTMAKKCSDLRADGQAQMYIMHVENLLRLLEELKMEGTNTHMDYKTELEHLKQVTRGNALDYWRINWGLDDLSSAWGSGKHVKSQPSFKGANQSDPLPDLPNSAQSGLEVRAEVHNAN